MELRTQLPLENHAVRVSVWEYPNPNTMSELNARLKWPIFTYPKKFSLESNELPANSNSSL